MEISITSHHIQDKLIAEIQSATIIIHTMQDGLDLLMNMYYQEYDAVILHEYHLCSDFFDLKTKIAGEILQKVSNYRMKLAIVGDFTKYNSKSLSDFMYESNRSGRVLFVSTVGEVLERWS